MKIKQFLSSLLFLTAFVFSLCLPGCTNKNAKAEDEFGRALIESNKFEIQLSKGLIHSFENSITTNPQLFLPFYPPIKAFHRNIQSLVNDLSEYHSSFSDTDNLDPLIVRYNSIMDTLEKYLVLQNNRNENTEIIRKDFFEKKQIQPAKIVALEIIGNIVRNEKMD